MTDISHHVISALGKFRSALATAGAFLESLDGNDFGYSLDRIERLEREVVKLKEQLH